MAENLIEVTDRTFENEVLQSELPVLVDFWAPWCGPCRMIAPAVEQLAVEYQGRVRFAKLNTDDSPETPGKLGIMGIPTLILFKGGVEAKRMVGALPKQRIKNAIDEVLG
ncbi:MAG: thioredoxin [Chloroflexi bacterium]|nr:thioredoxin [Chloroflexota bacterium]GIW10542.1 MAG: thioredoxin [Dehalococcoidia bacterium]